MSSGLGKAQTNLQTSQATGGPYFFSECAHLEGRMEGREGERGGKGRRGEGRGKGREGEGRGGRGADQQGDEQEKERERERDS